MKSTNRILSFYERLVHAPRGCVYQLYLDVDYELLRNMVSSADSYMHQLNKQNECYYAFVNFVSQIKSNQKIQKALNIFLSDLFFKQNSILPLLFLDKDRNLVFFDIQGQRKIPSIFSEFQKLISPVIENHWKILSYDFHQFQDILKQRLNCIEKFFFEEHGCFISELMNSFQDNISKESFKTYLRQRYLAKIHGDYDTVYPVKPPKITEEWRKERFSLSYDLPKIAGCSEFLKKMFCDATFKLEQYAVRPSKGICEVESGDVVIDGGAFVGDTAIYFARKTGLINDRLGHGGRVYAFEPIAENARYAELNVRENGLESVVEIVPYALSDANKTLLFVNESSASSAVETDIKEGNQGIQQEESERCNGLVVVKAVSLDNFIQSRGIKRIDFLKADLEGEDVNFVKGAIKSIEKYGPKCALTVYHKPEDFIEIPKLLMSARDDYVFYFRCESEPVVFSKRKK